MISISITQVLLVYIYKCTHFVYINLRNIRKNNVFIKSIHQKKKVSAWMDLY